MIDHVSIGVRDLANAKRFYDAALKPLDYSCLSESEGSLGYGRKAVALWIDAAERPVPADEKSGLHFCFAAPTRRSVDAFHAAALKAGGRDKARRVCAPITARTTTPPSRSIRTATASRPIAAGPGDITDADASNFAPRARTSPVGAFHGTTAPWTRRGRRESCTS